MTRIDTPYGPMFIDSPIEQAFYKAWCKRVIEYDLKPQYFYLKPQHAIGRYRADFAHLMTRTVIELVGHATHSTTAAIAYDCKRQREIEEQGWRVIRFGGREIFTDVEACVDEVGTIICNRMNYLIKRKKQASVTVVRENTTPQHYQPGDKVHHPLFGAGIVLKSDMDGSDEFVDVQFQDDRKHLCVKFAKLEQRA